MSTEHEVDISSALAKQTGVGGMTGGGVGGVGKFGTVVDTYQLRPNSH